MNRIELAPCRAQSAAYAAIIVNCRSTASETSRCLGSDLLLRERKSEVCKCLRRHTLLMSRNLTLRVVKCLDLDIALVQFAELSKVSSDCERIPRMDKSVDGHISFTTSRYRIDCELRSGVNVAADKYVRLTGLIRNRIRDSRSVRTDLDLRSVEQVAPLNTLADRKKYIRARNRDRILLIIFRCKSVILVKHSYALFEDDRFDLTVLCQDFLRSPAVHNFDSLFLGFRHLIRGCRHFFGRFQAEHGNFAAAGTDRCAGYVDSNITTADDNGLTRQILRRRRLLVHSHRAARRWRLVHDKIYFPKELYAGHYALSILSGNTCHAAALRTDCNVKCLEALRSQLIQCDILSDFHTAADLHAHLAYDVNLGFQNIFLKSEARNAVQKHAAGTNFFLKYSDRIAVSSQIICR